MGESFGDDVALGALLDRVVADLRGGVQAFLNIARFEDLALAIGEAGPNAGKAVRLKLEPHGESIGFTLAGAALTRLDLAHNAELILHVMADFVRNHIGLSKIAGGFETVMELTKESEVDINFLVVAAIEGSSGGLRKTAGRLDLAAEEHELWLCVGTSGTLENFAPSLLGAAEHAGDELAPFVAGAGLLRLSGRLWRDVGL